MPFRQRLNRLLDRRATKDHIAPASDIPHAAALEEARQAVLQTTELLEHILLWLPIKNLLLAGRICKRWRNVMQGSIKIQRALFLTPLPDSAGNALVNPFLLHTLASDSLLGVRSWSSLFHHRRWPYSTSSHRKMLLTNPPTPVSDLTFCQTIPAPILGLLFRTTHEYSLDTIEDAAVRGLQDVKLSHRRRYLGRSKPGYQTSGLLEICWFRGDRELAIVPRGISGWELLQRAGRKATNSWWEGSWSSLESSEWVCGERGEWAAL